MLDIRLMYAGLTAVADAGRAASYQTFYLHLFSVNLTFASGKKEVYLK